MLSETQGIIEENSLSFEDLVCLHTDKQEEYENAMISFSKQQKISRTFRTAAWILCGLTALSSLVFALIQKYEWYFGLLAVLGGFVMSVVIIGFLFLIIKPVFWMVRKKHLKELDRINKIQEELFLIKRSIVVNCCNKNYDLYSSLNNNKNVKHKPLEISEEWMNKQEEIFIKSAEIRFAKIEKDRLSEWQWVVSAATIIASIIIIAVAALAIWIAFCVAVVLIVVSMAITSVSGSYYRNDYYDKSYCFDDPYNSDNKERLILKFLSGLMPKISDIKKHIKSTEEEIKLSKEECSTIWKQLTLWRFPELDL